MPNCCSWPDVLDSVLSDMAGLVVRKCNSGCVMKGTSGDQEAYFRGVYILITVVRSGLWRRSGTPQLPMITIAIVTISDPNFQ